MHTAIIGQPAIGGFLDRSRDLLPYGLGTSIRHVVGSAGRRLRVEEEGRHGRPRGDRARARSAGTDQQADHHLGRLAARQRGVTTLLAATIGQ
jgi:hypothetical protein